jgi:hypothetical protein
MFFKGRVILTQHIPKKHNHSGIKIYKLCIPADYIKVYMVKDRQRTAQHWTATHAKVTNLKGNRRMWPQIVHGEFPFLP